MADMWIDVDAAVEVIVNQYPLIDDSDFTTRETAIAYNESGMDLVWNFMTSAGAVSQTAVTPTTSGDYDWAHVGDGIYKIEIPASGGASINNDTEGYGFFTGICDGVLAWKSPVYGFRDSDINDKLCDSAWSATAGFTGTDLSDILSTLDGPIDSAITQNTGLNSDILSTLDSAIHSTLDAIHSTIDGPIDSAITQNTTLGSDILSTLDGPVTSSLSNIESAIALISTDSDKITSILEDTGTTIPGAVSDVLSTLDGPITTTLSSILDVTGTKLDDKLTSILDDTRTVLDDKLDSILEDTGTTIQAQNSDILSTLDGPIDSAITQNTTLGSDVLSTLDGPVTSSLSNIESAIALISTDSDKITSILEDTGTSLPAQNSDILSTLDGPIDSAITQNTALGSDILSTLDGPVTSSLSNIESAIALISTDSDKITSILEDTGTTIPAAVSDVLSTLDGPVISTLDRNQNDLDSILEDTGTTIQAQNSDIISTLDGPIDSALTQNTGLVSDILSTIDGPVISAISSIEAKTDNLPDGIQKNTALTDFEFVMTDSTDHDPATGLTVTATRSIDGAAFASCANSVSEVSNGVYKIDLAAADLNGDVVTLRFTATNCDDTLVTIKTNA